MGQQNKQQTPLRSPQMQSPQMQGMQAPMRSPQMQAGSMQSPQMPMQSPQMKPMGSPRQSKPSSDSRQPMESPMQSPQTAGMQQMQPSPMGSQGMQPSPMQTSQMQPSPMQPGQIPHSPMQVPQSPMQQQGQMQQPGQMPPNMMQSGQQQMQMGPGQMQMGQMRPGMMPPGMMPPHQMNQMGHPMQPNMHPMQMQMRGLPPGHPMPMHAMQRMGSMQMMQPLSMVDKSSAKNEKDDSDSNCDDTESLDSNSSNKKEVVASRSRRNNNNNLKKAITLSALLNEGILEAGNQSLCIEYLGKKVFGDLLPNGKIAWENQQYVSPSLWATVVKKNINPNKKSGCGWNSVKYKGIKLDQLKGQYITRITNNTTVAPIPAVLQNNINQANLSSSSPAPPPPPPPQMQVQQPGMVEDSSFIDKKRPMKHAEIKSLPYLDPNTVVEMESFKDNQQPFQIVVSNSVLLVMDFHCHLTSTEVVGYLAGKWDANKQCLYVMQAFPCRCKLMDKDKAAEVEQEIANNMRLRDMTRVGWYHSHPSSSYDPTVRDIDVQYELQLSHISSHPVIGLICAPYQTPDPQSLESSFRGFWVNQPQESQDPQHLGIPMKVNYTEVHDQIIPMLWNELKMLVEYYKHQPDLIQFNKCWRAPRTFLDKIRFAIMKRLPKEMTDQNSQIVNDLLSLFLQQPPQQPTQPQQQPVA